MRHVHTIMLALVTGYGINAQRLKSKVPCCVIMCILHRRLSIISQAFMRSIICWRENVRPFWIFLGGYFFSVYLNIYPLNFTKFARLN